MEYCMLLAGDLRKRKGVNGVLYVAGWRSKEEERSEWSIVCNISLKQLECGLLKLLEFFGVRGLRFRV